MYTPEKYKNTNTKEVVDFIRANGFGVLITQLDGTPMATNIPMMLEEFEAGKFILSGHISKENKQCESFVDGTKALAVFNGPHAYVSSSWYSHENVSTWNYLAAQVSGKLYVLDQLALIESLIMLTEKYESKEQRPKYFENISEKVVRDNLTGITGFKIVVESVEASYKLSQNRESFDHSRIIDELEKRHDENSKLIAGEMKKRKN